MIVRDSAGEPTGILKDAAKDAIDKVRPPARAQGACRIPARRDEARGPRGSHLGAGSPGDPGDLAAWEALRAAGEMTVRVNYRPSLSEWQAAAAKRAAMKNDDWLRVGGIKGYADGSLGSSTALFFAPYWDDPTTSGVFAAEAMPLSRMEQRVTGADRAGLQVEIHAIGDRANAEILDLYERVEKANGAKDRRFRIEHAQHLRRADVSRFAPLSIVASMQPYHSIDDSRWAERRIGVERCRTTYPFRDLLDAGAKLAFGSDWDVAPLSPIAGIDAAVTRRTLDGKHPGGWVPEQRISVSEAARRLHRGRGLCRFRGEREGNARAGIPRGFRRPVSGSISDSFGRDRRHVGRRDGCRRPDRLLPAIRSHFLGPCGLDGWLGSSGETGFVSRIHRLPSEVIDRIAAGEVVERPASVVKELIENSLDAGAYRIEVTLEGGGISRILVRDDGSGMSEEDARLSLERHATSKIASDQDLAAVASYGFRGEALPSIAAVSQLTLTTSDGTTVEAVRLSTAYGSGVSQEPAGRPRGTDVLVEGLFAKTPARRKFLSTPEAEGRAAAAAVTRAALANPSVAFVLSSNGREILDAPAAANRPARILQVFGRETLGDLEEFEARSGPLKVSGFATRGSVTFPTRRFQYIFINGRPVEDRALARAIGQAARDAIRTDRHPGLFLFLTAEAGAVDVNVSPAKTQVRFADSGTAFRLVYHAVQSALLAGKEERRLKSVPAEPPQASVSEKEEPYGVSGAASSPGRLTPAAGRESGGASSAAHVEKKPPEIVLIGQHRESYIVASGPEGLLVIDQHAAHERILYERLRDRIASGRVLSQRLLLRALYEATPEEAETLSARWEDLAAAGFEIEPMSGRSYAIAALPAEATDRAPAETLREVLAQLADVGMADSGKRRDRLCASLACRSAVTIRYHLAPEEARRLLQDWIKTGDRFTCPHGRPVVLSMSEGDLEKFFKRR